jgi:hypothetical protein
MQRCLAAKFWKTSLVDVIRRAQWLASPKNAGAAGAWGAGALPPRFGSTYPDAVHAKPALSFGLVGTLKSGVAAGELCSRNDLLTEFSGDRNGLACPQVKGVSFTS